MTPRAKKKTGRLVVLCGIDGSGKTVQKEALALRARSEGLKVRTIDFPRYDEGPFGELIARYLRGEFAADPLNVDPYLASLPFACDRWQAAPLIRRWLAEGALVICNRYVAANLAHQGGKTESPRSRKAFVRWVCSVEYEVFQVPRPDLHVLLDMPAEVATQLVKKKGKRDYLRKKQDIHEKHMEHLEATRRMYQWLARNNADWVRIQCARTGAPRPVEAVAEKVWSLVSRLFHD